MALSIESVHAREVLDSRGQPTVEVEVTIAGGWSGRAIVPSGASTGRHEALELRDGDLRRYRGRGVRWAVRNVNETIAPELIGADANDQGSIDGRLIALDGTANKSRLGANALLGVSLGVARAVAAARSKPPWLSLGGDGAHVLPLPMVNIISGGLHAGQNLDFQDYLVVPVGAETYGQALEMSIDVYRCTRELLTERGLSTLKADEGGFGPALSGNVAPLDLLMEAVERARYEPGKDIAFAIDVAATHFFDGERYRLTTEGKDYDAPALVDLLATWVERYPIVSIEDGLAEDDWAGWKTLTNRLGNAVQLIGDDLFTTNPARVERGIREGVANAVLVKMNQIGTLTETLQVIGLARRAGYQTVISARSGESEDSSIADLAVATGAGQIKVGSVAQSERLAKYNQLLRIEEWLGSRATLGSIPKPGDHPSNTFSQLIGRLT
jgi:enolase